MAVNVAVRVICRNKLTVCNNIRYINKIQIPSIRKLSTSFQCLARKYSEKHEWVDVSGDVGTIGITQYAQDSLGDIVYAQLPEVNTQYAQGEECGALESVKAASELYSPVSGTVTAVNLEVEDQPSLINQSCYEKGWLFKMNLSAAEELDGLMGEEDYNKYVKELDS